MAMQPTDFDGALPIDSYGPGFFRVGGQVFHGPVLVTGQGAAAWDGLDDTAPLLALAGKVDLLFLGTGAEIAHPPAALADALDEVGVMVEAMASPTAARSYNVTLSEGRRVACALMPV